MLMAEWRFLIHKSIGRSLKKNSRGASYIPYQTENLKILFNDLDLRAQKKDIHHQQSIMNLFSAEYNAPLLLDIYA